VQFALDPNSEARDSSTSLDRHARVCSKTTISLVFIEQIKPICRICCQSVVNRQLFDSWQNKIGPPTVMRR